MNVTEIRDLDFKNAFFRNFQFHRRDPNTDFLEHKRQLMALQEATADPAPDKISLMEKVSILREETKKYEEMKMEEAKDHSLIAFRQNANNLARRKEAQAEILQEKRQEEEELRPVSF